jgi:hypothetical protein
LAGSQQGNSLNSRDESGVKSAALALSNRGIKPLESNTWATKEYGEIVWKIFMAQLL